MVLCVEVRRQDMGTGTLLLPCGSWNLGSHCQPWQQAPLPPEVHTSIWAVVITPHFLLCRRKFSYIDFVSQQWQLSRAHVFVIKFLELNNSEIRGIWLVDFSMLVGFQTVGKNISACEVFPFSFQNFHENSRRNDKNIQTHNAIVNPRRDSTTGVLVYLASVSAAPRWTLSNSAH